jgi:flagellar protein FlbD
VILITRLNGTKLYVNAELIKTVEPTPDSVITLTTGEKLVAREPSEEIIKRIVEYQQKVHTNPFLTKSGE